MMTRKRSFCSRVEVDAEFVIAALFSFAFERLGLFEILAGFVLVSDFAFHCWFVRLFPFPSLIASD